MLLIEKLLVTGTGVVYQFVNDRHCGELRSLK